MEYKSSDVLNYTDFLDIHNKIINKHNAIYLKYGKVAFEPKSDYIWALNDIIYKEKFLNFLEDTQNFKDYYYNFEGFRNLNKYMKWNIINYQEINDLINDLDIIDVDEIGNKNIWDFNYLLNWNEDSNIEWEE